MAPNRVGTGATAVCGWLSLTGSGGNSVSENRGGGTRPVMVYALVVTRVGECRVAEQPRRCLEAPIAAERARLSCVGTCS